MIAGQRAEIDTTTASGKLVFGLFAALAEIERELILKRTKAGLPAAYALGRKAGRRFDLTKALARLAQAATHSRNTKVRELCEELGAARSTLYRHVDQNGDLRAHGERVFGIHQQTTVAPTGGSCAM